MTEWSLLAAAMGLCGMGTLLVYSTGSALLLRRHQLALGVGLGGLALARAVGPDLLRRRAREAYWVSLLLLLAVLVVGHESHGARRWLALGPLRFQPAEMARLALVLTLARWLEREDRLQDLWGGTVAALGLAVPLAVPLCLQPDYGSTALVVALALGMAMGAGAPRQHLLLLGAVAGLGMALLAWIEPYRVQRLLNFPSDQQRLSLYALSLGGWWGRGWGEGVVKLRIPDVHTDFALAALGEELGLVGLLGALGGMWWVIRCGLRLALRARQRFESLLALGISLNLGLQAISNAAMVLCLIPPKGFPFPFLSYGGSALLFDLIQVGILASVAART